MLFKKLFKRKKKEEERLTATDIYCLEEQMGKAILGDGAGVESVDDNTVGHGYDNGYNFVVHAYFKEDDGTISTRDITLDLPPKSRRSDFIKAYAMEIQKTQLEKRGYASAIKINGKPVVFDK